MNCRNYWQWSRIFRSNCRRRFSRCHRLSRTDIVVVD